MDGPSPFLTVVAYGDRRGADAHPRSPCPIDQVLVTRKTFLTGGQKAGYLFAGLLGGAGCAILASLCNMDAPYRSDCTKFALIGLGIRIALSVIGYIAVLPLLAMPY